MFKKLLILFVVLTLFTITNARKHHHFHSRYSRNATHSPTDLTTDDYYDWYHYDVSNGHQHKIKLTFVFIFITLSLFVMT